MKDKAIYKKIAKIAGTVLLYVSSVALLLVVTLLIAVYMISSGKSPVVKELFVTTMCDTGALDFMAYMFNSEEEVKEILAKSNVVVPKGETDTSKIIIRGEDSDEKEKDPEIESADKKLGIEYNEEGVALVDVKGKTYVGKMLVVKDPTRVKVAGLNAYGEGKVGKTTEQMAKDANALAATNAGGYAEQSDYKTGGIPEGRNGAGLVIIDGKLLWGSRDSKYEIIGIDKKGILYVDTMTAGQALDKGIQYAVNWGPVLVKNGEPCIVESEGSNPGFHPRTAIGQRSDGSMLILVIDGRQSHSMGASYEDLVEIMVRFGAVNAANLDGGMSSYMVYDGEIITSPYMLYFNGKRTVATSFIVTRK